MAIPKLPFSFPDVVRYPLHVVVYLLLSYFVYKEFTKKDECADLRTTSSLQAKRIEALESKIDELTYSIAVKSGVLEKIIKSKKDTSNNTNHENIN